MTKATETDLDQMFETAIASVRRMNTPEYRNRVEEAVEVLVNAFIGGKKLLVYGNGGSASDAQHICGELVGRFLKERKGLPAIALTSNQSLLTAWSNDYSFDTVFERQVQALGQPGDVAWGISTSGNSVNVIRASRTARESGLTTIALTGHGGGGLAEWSDVVLAAPSRETPRIQEIHLITYHAICAAVEARLF